MKKQLKQEIINAVLNSVKDYKKIALALSGGIDSSVIAKILKDNNVEFKAYSVSFNKETSDTKTAETFAKDMKIDFKKIVFGGDCEPLIKSVIKIINSADPVNISVGMPMALAAEEAVFDGKEVLISGLGSDEIFAGYSSHAKALEKNLEAVQAECKRRINEQVKKDIERDKRIGRKYKIDIAVPFLDKNLVKLALEIPPEKKISKTEKKIILRKIAKELKIPKYICERPKKAAQYGSGSFKAIEAAAKQKGFKFVKDYLNHISEFK